MATVLSDFVVIIHSPAAASTGKWKSARFDAGGRLTLSVGGQEKHNAYLLLTLTSPEGGPLAAVRPIVNGHPLPQLIEVKANSQRTALVTFPASFLRPDGSNEVELHSKGETGFIVLYGVCQFRQSS